MPPGTKGFESFNAFAICGIKLLPLNAILLFCF
jgi:hypothetical protein